MLKHKWTHVPRHWDIIAQVLYNLGTLLTWPSEALTNLAGRIVDAKCKCERCEERRKEDR